MNTVTIDLRCPTGSTSLMGRLVTGDNIPEYIEGLFLQLHCRECTKDFRRLSEGVLRVLHLYTTTGEFVETQIQFREGADKYIDLETQSNIFKLSTEFKRKL